MHDLIIIGAGPAGLTAGLYAGRYKLNTLILEKLSPGGQIIFSPTIENFPGFPSGIATEELTGRFKEQVEDLGVSIIADEVTEILPDHKAGSPAYRVVAKEASFQAKSVIIASGAKPKPLGLAGEDKFIGRGVSYCGTCDGPLYKDKEVMVAGGGDRAVEEAIFLATYAKRVTLVHRRDELRASKIMQKRALDNKKIEIIWDTIPVEALGDHVLTGLKVKNVKSDKEQVLEVSGLFYAIGHKPNTDFLEGQLALDENGYIKTIAGSSVTNIPGVFACGDVMDPIYKQAITAAGSGCKAALDVERFLGEQE